MGPHLHGPCSLQLRRWRTWRVGCDLALGSLLGHRFVDFFVAFTCVCPMQLQGSWFFLPPFLAPQINMVVKPVSLCRQGHHEYRRDIRGKVSLGGLVERHVSVGRRESKIRVPCPRASPGEYGCRSDRIRGIFLYLDLWALSDLDPWDTLGSGSVAHFCLLAGPTLLCHLGALAA